MEVIGTLKKALFIEHLNDEEMARFRQSLHQRKYPKGNTIIFQ